MASDVAMARLVFERYTALPKTGKPGLNTGAGGGGYTVLAGVVAEWERERGEDGVCEKEMRVVAMGTGTKCIGGGVHERSASGACVRVCVCVFVCVFVCVIRNDDKTRMWLCTRVV